MTAQQFRFWVFELRELLREIKNPRYFLDSQTQLNQFNSVGFFIHIFFHQECFIKLLDFRILSILLSHNSQRPASNRYLTIKGVVLFFVVVLLYRINNRKMVESKNLYLTELLPIPMNSIGPRNDTLEESFFSFNINRLIVSLLYLPKGKWKGSSDQSRARDHFDSISNEDSEYHIPEEIENFLGNSTRSIRSFFSDRLSELHLVSNPTERSNKLLKKEQDVCFIPCRRSEKKEIVNIFRIITYLQNTVSIHPISSDPGCDMVLKDELDMDSCNKISFLNKNPFFDLFHLFHDRNGGVYTLRYDFESEEIFKEMADLFTLSITEPDLVYHKGFSFFLHSYGLDQKQFLNEVFDSRDESKNKSLLVLPPIFYEENEFFYRYRRIRKKWVRISCENDLEDPKQKRVVFARNNIMEAVNQYGLIRNLIQIQYSTYEYIRNYILNLIRSDYEYLRYNVIYQLFLIMQRNQIGNDILNHRMKYRINQHLSNLKQSQKNWFDPLIFLSRTERSMNWDPNAYRYKWSTRSKNFQEYLEHFSSEQRSRFLFQVVFDRLRINQYSFDWSEVSDNKDWSKLLRFFLSKFLPFLSNSLPFFFVSFKNIPIHRSEIQIYELKGPNDPLCNQLVEPSVLQIVHLKKMKPFLLDDHETSPKKSMIDSFYTRNNCRKDSYLSMISHDQDNWLNPVKPFHRSSLISSFYKTNRLRFLNNLHNFCFYCKKRFPFYVEEAPIKNYDFTYGQFLNILFIRNKIFSLCGGKKKQTFWERNTVSPIESHVSNIFIPNDFLQSGNERYNLYKSFHFPIQSDPFVRRAIYLISDISVRPLIEGQIVNFETTYCQPLSNMNLSDSEEKNLHQYPNFNSNMGLIYTPYSEKCLLSEISEKRKSEDRKNEERISEERISEEGTESLFWLKMDLRKSVEKEKIYRSFLSKWNLLQTYMSWFLTSTGYKYLPKYHKYFNFILKDTLFDLLSILSRSQIGLIFEDRMDQLKELATEKKSQLSEILEEKSKFLKAQFPGWDPEWDLDWDRILNRKQIATTRVYNLLLSEEMIHRNNGSSLISTHLRSPNVQEFFYLTLFLLLVAGYLVSTHLFCVSQAYRGLQTEFEKVKDLTIPSYIIELQKLRKAYPTSTSEPNSFWLNTFFLVALGQLGSFLQDFIEERWGSENGGQNQLRRLRKKNWKQIWKRNLIELIRTIPNPIPIDRITFLRNTRFLSHTSKKLYSLINTRRESVTIHPDKLPFWILNNYYMTREDKELLMQFSTLTRENRIEQILLSLTHSDHLSKNDSAYQMIEKPGAIYLRHVVDLHKKFLLNYEFNPPYLAERRIFLASYQATTYSQTSRGVSSFRFPSAAKPFSFRVVLSPPRGILLIGSIGIGRSYLVKYLATNSYLPLITVFLDRYFVPLEGEEFEFEYDDDPDVHTIEDEYLDATGSYFGYRTKHWEARDSSYNIDGRNDIDVNDDSAWDFVFNNYDFDVEWEFQTDKITWKLYEEYEYMLFSLLDIDRLYLSIQFLLAKLMSPCILWIPNIHQLDVLESAYLYISLFTDYFSYSSLSGESERRSTRNNLVIASTHIPKKVDPALIDPYKLDTCIQIRGLLVPQQRKHFFTLSYTRGFHLETNTNGFQYITMGSTIRDLGALNDEVLSIGITQKKSILDTNIIRFALHRQTWAFRSHPTPMDPGLIFYQIGRAFAQKAFVSEFLIDPISVYIKKKSCNPADSYLYRWYFELGTSMKKLTILLYLLSCSAGSVAQDLWSPPASDETEKHNIACCGLLENESELVHGLLELESVLVSSSRTDKDCSQFDNDPLFRPEPKSSLEMLKSAFCSIRDRNIFHALYAPIAEEEREEVRWVAEEIFNEILWAPRIWRPWDFLLDWVGGRSDDLGFPYWDRLFWGKRYWYDEEAEEQEDFGFGWGEDEEAEDVYVNPFLKHQHQEDPDDDLIEDEFEYDSDYNKLPKEDELPKDEEDELQEDELQEDEEDEFQEDEDDSESETMFDIRDKSSKDEGEAGFFHGCQFIWDPGDPLFSLFKDPSFVSVFSHREFFADEEILKKEILISTSRGRRPKSPPRRWFQKDVNEKLLEFFIFRQRWLRTRTNSSLSNEVFRSNTLPESYRSNTLSESYQYLANLFRSNEILLNKLRKTLWRKRWLFPDEIKIFFMENK